ncbi:MAG: VOC family protein [Nitrospinota bacterium]
MAPSFDHIGLATPDLDRSVAFYRDVMGFELISRRPMNDGARAVFRVGEGLLVLFHRPHAGYVEKVRKPRSGVHHLAFWFEPKEYEGIIERCKANGVEIMMQELNQGAKGTGLATYFYDPDGNDIEIKKYEDLPEHAEYMAEGYTL